MLKIINIKIEGMVEACVTDNAPTITFGLESNREEEELSEAFITVNDWQINTKDQMNNVYTGPLAPFTTYVVHIKATGTSGDIAEATTTFKTGRLNTPWIAQWITNEHYDFPKKVSPLPMTFQKQFTIAKPIHQAWINATAFGVYELLLNNQKIGNDYFAPGFTSYKHQIQYQTYDVTNQLASSNTITAIVAGGWAVGSFNYIRKNKISADRQAFLLELHVVYEDNTKDIIISDDEWQVTMDGNYRMAEWYDGETYDATINLKQTNWLQASITRPRYQPNLIAQYGEPVRIQEKLESIHHFISPSGELIFDFGQNFAGVIETTLKAKQGQIITFRHAEVLVNDELFVKSLRTAKATATYICNEGEQTYSPKLTYMGFRYVGVTGIDINAIKLYAYVLHSNFEEIGYFECSNPLINQLHSNIKWGGKSNFIDIPTDCPQRDERQGWTGDIAVFARTACFNFDMSRFFDKWLLDMRAEQGRGGGIPMVIPRGGDLWPIMATSAWGDSCVLVPWAVYLARGNKRVLEQQYPTIKKFLKAAKKWASFLSFTPTQAYIWKYPFHFGDWCAPDENIKQWMKKGKWVATAYFANSCGIAAQIAKILHLDKDAEYYTKLRNKIIESYRKVFTDGKGSLNKEFQTGYVLPLHFEMTKGNETKMMINNLVKLVKHANNHLTTGFTGTPYILFALSDYGYKDVAYDLLLQEECPSWLYEIKAGGTTVWERWDALRPDGTVNISELTDANSTDESKGGMVSFNHYANGAVGDWLYRRMAGIEPTSGGYKTFTIAPIIGGGITYAKATINTPYGIASSLWKINENVFSIHIQVPVSTQCELKLPNGAISLLKSGQYTFTCELS